LYVVKSFGMCRLAGKSKLQAAHSKRVTRMTFILLGLEVNVKAG